MRYREAMNGEVKAYRLAYLFRQCGMYGMAELMEACAAVFDSAFADAMKRDD